MTSPAVLSAELERVFGRCWLYLGHESEIREPGDYVRRSVGGRPVFVVRSARTGEIHAFHNTCTHRGAVVCRRERGNSKVFQCFYHAWSFDTDGKLVGVPDREAYGGGLDFDALGLAHVARLESYRGFLFLCYDPDAVDLRTYLGEAADYLDLVIDAAADGVEIITGTHEYGMDANWKLLVENSIDGYHAAPVHDTYFKYLAELGSEPRLTDSGRARDLGNGHAVVEGEAPWGRPTARWEPIFGEQTKDVIERIRADLTARHGAERARRMADTSRNLLIYPNLIVNDIMAVTVRTFMPTASDRTEITAWQLAPLNEHPDLRRRRLDSFLTFLGPGGFATPDDIEALESCQQGFASGGVEWNDISRGMARDAQLTDEEQMRAFWRQWSRQVERRGAPVGAR
ncbi:aromatic ring-hydroxylating oxygenase subunit alpha [Pseudonocardia alaniniphila]|uniref:Aromatic ring-hydroxylating dioxygenase subunit alpha n=1 Tax=Pseudonocardia alaniniphila TaxID=75291 RepID=A0ABS9TQT5_9PSEU|nr:aromatic ring-hydroxylating dioxygenase subunit alpha [Pseudonocardia alaniniphila]MCH6170891.1 aromatic ring-hydroxylating dioxygenase subunit alpha [Pseudonocardia alaniniphila]